MRKRMLSILLLVAASPVAGQDPPRRTDQARALRALLEAQALSAHAVDVQRALVETQQAALLAQAAWLDHDAGLQRAIELQAAAHAPLAAQRALLEAQQAAVRDLDHRVELQRALAAALTGERVDDMGADADFEAVLDAITERGVPEAWAPQDPADSLYRAGREQLNAGRYGAAARTFERIRTENRFERSQYRPAAFYWEAFALSRIGSTADLRRAREILSALENRYGVDERPSDADALATAIEGRLARLGDRDARAKLTRAVEATTVRAANLARASEIATRARADVERVDVQAEVTARTLHRNLTTTVQQCPDDDIRTVALNALLQMDSEQALPLLREVTARRDECSVHLRRRAMMMLAEQQDPAAQSILIEAALADPDPEVREQATFWLSHVPGDAAVEALARILAQNPTPAVQQRAIFALGQQQGARAAEILREYALREGVPEDLRRHIVFSLAHSSNADNASFLRELYDRTSDTEMKRQIVMTLSHDPSPAIADWLLSIATDRDEPMEIRRHALLTTANAPGLDSEQLGRLYDESDDREMRRHVLLVLSQRVHDDPAAVGKLVEIARTTQDAELKKMVVYMLSESRDPRALELMAEIVRRPIR